MGGGVQVEKRRPVSLTALFWRYLLTVGIGVAAAALAWWMTILLLLQWEAVLPASYAASHVAETADLLAERFSPDAIPHYYRWAVFTAEGETVDSGSMDRRRLEYARQSLLLGGANARSFPYTQYHCLVPLQEGGVCVLQYDYSMPYTVPGLALPEFQIFATLVLLGLWILLAVLCTRRYTRILRRDANAITGATRAIAARQLGQPLAGTARVRELEEAMEAMDLLRQNLAASLEQQWAMEQQRQRELAALTHDLKTPLAIISGNGELLAEDALSAPQRASVDAILRGAGRLEDYLERLRAFSSGGGEAEPAAETALTELFAVWRAAGEDLCGPGNIRFLAAGPPDVQTCVRREAVCRAVLNLLDNAARYAGPGGEVALSARVEGDLLAVTVTDSGPGFPAEALVRAGKELYTSAAREDGHTGWGLCYARQAARDHGGELRLWNTDRGAAAELRWTR